MIINSLFFAQDQVYLFIVENEYSTYRQQLSRIQNAA
jgi:hypothetical protein